MFTVKLNIPANESFVNNFLMFLVKYFSTHNKRQAFRLSFKSSAFVRPLLPFIPLVVPCRPVIHVPCMAGRPFPVALRDAPSCFSTVGREPHLPVKDSLLHSGMVARKSASLKGELMRGVVSSDENETRKRGAKTRIKDTPHSRAPLQTISFLSLFPHKRIGKRAGRENDHTKKKSNLPVIDSACFDVFHTSRIS